MLTLLQTSGSTGKPKGVVHTTGGYLLGAAVTVKYVFDVHHDDKFACMADIGWITGHTYVSFSYRSSYVLKYTASGTSCTAPLRTA